MHRLLAMTGFVSALAGSGFAQSGSIGGTVTTTLGNRPLAGVNVVLSTGEQRVATDIAGRYQLPRVASGTQQVIFSALGYQSDTLSVNVVNNQQVMLNAVLEQKAHELNRMRISGRLEGQTRAYNLQKNAEHIKNVVAADYIDRFADQNSAEALQRVSGISVQRDQGEGRYVQIRGSKPAYTTVSVNGVTIPAPEGDVRSVALDVIPADVLSQIEVSKAVTPQMDGGAIGGQVNLETRSALSPKLSLQSSAAVGYNNLNAQRDNGVAPLMGQGSLTVSKRLLQERLGMLVGASYLRTNRGSDNTEFSWEIDDEENSVALEELELRDYTVIRDRLGVNAVVDWKANDKASLSFSGLYNRFGDQEYRRRTTLAFDGADSEAERELKDRYEVQDIVALRLGSELKIAGLTLEPSLAYSFAQEREPDAFYSTFVMADSMSVQTADKSLPTFFSATDITDAAAYELDAVEVEDNLTNERTVEGALDLTLPLSLGEKILELKGGLKGRQREKMRDNSYQEYSRSQDMVLSEVAGDFANPDFLGGEYPNSAKNFQDPQKIKDDFDRGGYEATPAEDLLEDNWLGDYEVTEEIAAGYLQAKLGVEKLSLLGGVRIEYTMADYLGYRIESQVSSFKGSSSTTEVMPMVHLRFSPLDNLNLRAAYTKTFARPDFYDLVPFYLRDENSIELGNPDLTNTHAHNIDILGEYFFESLGLASAGFFVKSITDFIYNGAYSVDSLEFSQKINGDAGLLYGAELSIEKQLSFLPGALSGLGIGGNYTLAQSEAEVTPVAGTAKRTITLPGQSEQVLNAYVHYEKFGLSARVALNYHSPFLDEVGESAQQDVYYNEHLQLDASISYTVGESGLVVFADAVNLTNEPLRYFMEYNDERYPRQQEFYSWWANIGIKYSF